MEPNEKVVVRTDEDLWFGKIVDSNNATFLFLSDAHKDGSEGSVYRRVLIPLGSIVYVHSREGYGG
jgi:hypothetical protein